MKNSPLLVALLTVPLSAQESTSANYSLLHSDPSSTGASISSATANITVETATGSAFSGESPVGTIQAKANFPALLYDPVSLNITASVNPSNEGSSPMLSASAIMDDETTLSLPPTEITWSILFGPIIQITPSGLAVSTTVYQNEIAQVQGLWLGISGTEDITVLNIDEDDFGTYAADGIDDDWQVNWFPPQFRRCPQRQPRPGSFQQLHRISFRLRSYRRR